MAKPIGDHRGWAAAPAVSESRPRVPSLSQAVWGAPSAEAGWACAARGALASFAVSSIVTESAPPLYSICLFPPLAIGLSHFSLIRAPCQGKAVQGGRSHHGALGISHSVPIVVNGNLAPRPFIPVSSIDTVKNLWILQHQYPARNMEGQQQFVSLIYSSDGLLAYRTTMNQHLNKIRSQISYFGRCRFSLQSY